MKRIVGTTILLLAALLSQMAAAASVLEQANQLVSEGKYIEAFDLLEPLEFDMSGDETYDLLFGFVALEAGHISLSTLALERVLAVNPDNNTARFHLARAYFVLSDFDGARREFEMLLSMNPTTGIRETVGQYLDAIAAREPGAKTVTSGYVALALGSDSNVTGGVSENPLSTPATGLYDFPESGVEDDDEYSDLSAGFDLVHRYSDINSLYVGGDLYNRAHQDRDDLDYLLVNLRGGYQRSSGNQVYRAGLAAGYLKLDDDPYQDSAALELEWRNTIAQRTQIGAVLTHTQYRHDDDEDEVSDYDDLGISLSYLRVLGEHGDKIVSVALDFGHEDDLNERDDGNQDYVEISVTGQMQLNNKSSGFLLLSYAENEYDDINTLFAKERSDSQISLVAGVVFDLSKSVSIRATAVLSEARSNLSLFDTSREDISISLRKDFL